MVVQELHDYNRNRDNHQLNVGLHLVAMRCGEINYECEPTAKQHYSVEPKRYEAQYGVVRQHLGVFPFVWPVFKLAVENQGRNWAPQDGEQHQIKANDAPKTPPWVTNEATTAPVHIEMLAKHWVFKLFSNVRVFSVLVLLQIDS